MSLKLTTSLSQRLVLTPQLRQRIEMLQMTTLELSDLIQQQLLENPVLEEVAEVVGSDGGEESGGDDVIGEESARDSFEEIDFGREFQDYLDPGYKTQEIEYKEDAPTFEQFLTRPPSLADHLEWQLHMSSVDGGVLDAAVSVIGNLDADGRLNATNEEIAAMGNWSEEVVEQARQAVMLLDPVGCGV